MASSSLLKQDVSTLFFFFLSFLFSGYQNLGNKTEKKERERETDADGGGRGGKSMALKILKKNNSSLSSSQSGLVFQIDESQQPDYLLKRREEN